MSRLLLGVAALVGLVASPGHAQDASPPEQAVVVTGERDRAEAVRSYVEGVTTETDGQIARFEAPICPASFGLPAEQNRRVEARIREIAAFLGRGAPPGCRPNVVVVVAEKGGDFVRLLRRERPRLFATLAYAELRAIRSLAGPVRAWHLVETRGADGRPMQRIDSIGSPPRPVARGYRLDGVSPSLTSRPTRQDLALSFIVFDLPAVDGLTWLQIADHAAMRALARTEGAGLPPRRSILTLLSDRRAGGETAGELTDWDAAYLTALYRTGNAVSAHQQRSNMTRTMRRALAGGP